jgi:hypothetical protein
MNREQIERALRQPHPLERQATVALPGQLRVRRGRTLAQGSTLFLPLVIALVAVAMALRMPSEAGPGAAASIPSNGPNLTKAPETLSPQSPEPPVAVGPCQSGSVKAAVAGWGPAGGTQYVLIALTIGGPACSLPVSPGASIVDSSGAAMANTTTGSSDRIAISSSLNARVGIDSLCSASAATAQTISLDLGATGGVSVTLPSGFDVPCTGGQTSMFVDDLFAPVGQP